MSRLCACGHRLDEHDTPAGIGCWCGCKNFQRARLWRRQPPPCPSTWACVAETTRPDPVWLGTLHEVTYSGPFSAPTRSRNGTGCHGDGWCVHCGRQLPRLTAGPRPNAADDLRELLARVQRITPLLVSNREGWRSA